MVVRTDKQDSWKPATVVDSHSSPRSYVIDDGSQLRRNRVHLKPSNVSTSQDEIVSPITGSSGEDAWQDLGASVPVNVREKVSDLLAADCLLDMLTMICRLNS